MVETIRMLVWSRALCCCDCEHFMDETIPSHQVSEAGFAIAEIRTHGERCQGRQPSKKIAGNHQIINHDTRCQHSCLLRYWLASLVFYYSCGISIANSLVGIDDWCPGFFAISSCYNYYHYGTVVLCSFVWVCGIGFVQMGSKMDSCCSLSIYSN
jgi:hypothetical protein